MERLEPEIRFNEARDLLSEVSRRLRRAISPFANDDKLGSAIAAAKEALLGAQKSLNGVRPTGTSREAEVPYAIYYAVENDFANINGCVADLLGLFEKQTFDVGESDAGRA